MPKFTAETASTAGKKGGQTTVQRHGHSHMAAVGKRGFTAMGNKHWRGDRARYLQFLQAEGLAAIDPFPANGAWHRPIPTPNDS